MQTVLRNCWWIMVWSMVFPTDGWGQTCGPQGCTPPNGNAAIAHRAACRIVHLLPSGARCIGSGTLVDRDERYGLIITCQHLFREGTGVIHVVFSDGKTFEGRLLQQDAVADLAAVLIARPSVEPAPVASRPPQPGEIVWSCGYGSDGRYVCNQGRVVGYVRADRMTGWETLELTGQARQGDSGGPVFNAQGELVAVLWGTDGRTVGGTYCGRVDRFLRQTARYLLPWNARNDPTNRTPSTDPGPTSSDLARIETRLDRIVELLGQGRLPSEHGSVGGAASAGLDRAPDAPKTPDSRLPGGSSGSGGSPGEEKTRTEGSVLHQMVRDLLGEIGDLPERFQARLEKVQAAGAQNTRETVRAYVQDFLAEKLADGSVGWTVGRLLAGALGLSAPLAIGVTLGAWLIARRIGRKVQAGEPLLVQQLASRISSALASGRESAGGSPQGPLPPPSHSAA